MKTILERNLSTENNVNEKCQHNRTIIIAIIAVILIIMAITNPTKDEYVSYVKEKILQENKDDILTTGLTMLLGKPLVKPLPPTLRLEAGAS